MMAGGAVQQNGIFSSPHHHNQQQPQMESDPPDSRKRPLETPTEASSTKRTNTGGAFLQPLFETEGIVFPDQETETHEEGEYFLKVLIPSYAAGSIIGKGGQTIVQLQKETGATIKLSKSKDFYPGDSILGATKWMLSVEGEVRLCSGRDSSFLTALSVFFASFYVYNIEYPEEAAPSLEFIQRFFIRINPENSKCASKHMVSKTSGKTVQRKNHGLNPHVAKLISDFVEYHWQNN